LTAPDGHCSLLVGELVLGFFLWGIGLLALDLQLGFLLIEFHELGEIELGFLEELNLSHKHVLEGEDLAALLLDFLSNSVRNAKRYN
jgi:hypothetical protein